MPETSVAQTLHGVRKAELYQEPLVALACKKGIKYVSFVFVPSQNLLAYLLTKLHGVLEVSSVWSYVENGTCNLSDVYIGTYSDLAEVNLRRLIVNFERMACNSQDGHEYRLRYLIYEDFHNFKTSVNMKYGQIDAVRDFAFNAFERALSFSATASPALANAALQRIGFKGVEDLPSDQRRTPGDFQNGEIRSIPQEFLNLITEVPFKHIQKRFMHVGEPQEVALGLLEDMCQTSPTAKAIILTGSSKSGREIVSKWDKSFEVTCIDDRMPLAEEVEQTLSFASHSQKRLLISTRLVTEGLDIPSLKMVIVLDVWPSLLEYIHAVSGLHDSGILYHLSRESESQRKGWGYLAPLENSCIRAKLRKLYQLDSMEPEGSHRKCCESRECVSEGRLSLMNGHPGVQSRALRPQENLKSFPDVPGEGKGGSDALFAFYSCRKSSRIE